MIIKKAPNIKILQDLVNQCNNVPLKDGLSPCQWMFGTHQKSSLPMLCSNFSNRINDKTYKFHLQKKMENYKQKFKQACKRTRPLKPIKPNTKVLVYDHKRSAFLQKAIVIRQGSTPSSYILEDPYGHQFKRNRRQIKPVTIPRSTKSTTYLL